MRRLLLLAQVMLMWWSTASLGQCNQWQEVLGIGPDYRIDSAMAYDSRRGVTVLFGGRVFPSDYFGDTWEWDGAAWKLVATDGPRARYNHVMTFDSKRGVTVLFGGYPDDRITWEWDGVEWSRAFAGGPSADYVTALTFDEAHGECVLFTGYLENRSETWTWNGEQWELVSADGPSPRSGPGMTYDSARQRVVLCGGRSDGSILDETWALDGRGWTLLAQNLPGEFVAFAYDSQCGVTVGYSGWGTGTRTIEFSPDLWLRRSPVTIVREPGEQAEFAIDAEGSGELGYQWYFDGRRLSDFGPFSGTRTETMMVDPVLPETVGPYSVEVSTACGSISSSTASLIIVDPKLTVYDDCHRSNEVAVLYRQTTPRGRVYLLFAREPGQWELPQTLPCGGTVLGLERSTTTLLFHGFSSFEGDGLLRRVIGPSARGGYLQLVDESTCRTSDVKQIGP